MSDIVIGTQKNKNEGKEKLGDWLERVDHPGAAFPPFCFPDTIRDLKRLQNPELRILLNFYGLDSQSDLKSGRDALGRYIGLRFDVSTLEEEQ